MKELKEIISDCNISFNHVINNYRQKFDALLDSEKDWLINLEDKTIRFNDNAVQNGVDEVIRKLKDPSYLFKSVDTAQLSLFIGKINGIIRIANRINNFEEGAELEDGRRLCLFELFNRIKESEKLAGINFELNKNLRSFIPHLFSVVKHCQDPTNYPIYYRYWKNVFGKVLNQNDDYDSLCEFYRTISFPQKHLAFGASRGGQAIHEY